MRPIDVQKCHAQITVETMGEENGAGGRAEPDKLEVTMGQRKNSRQAPLFTRQCKVGGSDYLQRSYNVTTGPDCIIVTFFK